MIFAKMRRHGLTPSSRTYNIVIASRLKAGNTVGAEAALLEMKESVGVDIHAYNKFMAHHASKNAMQSSLDTMERIRAQGLTPDGTTYEQLVLALVEGGRLDAAADVVNKTMQSQGIHPTDHIYLTLVKGYVTAGRVDEALELIASNRGRLQPALITRLSNTALLGLLKHDKVPQALALLESMQQSGSPPDDATYNMILSQATRHGDMSVAQAFYDRVYKNSTRTKSVAPATAGAYTSTADTQADNNNNNGSSSSNSSSSSSSSSPNNTTSTSQLFGFNILLEGYLRNSNPEAAFNLLKSLAPARPNTVTFNVLLDRYSHRRDYAAMRFLLAKMKELDVPADTITMNVLVNAAASTGDPRRIRAILDCMVANNMRLTTVTFTSAMRGYCSVGDMASAAALLEEMKQCNVRPNVYTYTVMIAGYCKNRQISSAFDIFQTMKRTRHSPNRVTYQTLLLACIQVGSVDIADPLLREMRAAGYVPDAGVYGSLITALRKQGKLDRAIELEREMHTLSRGPRGQHTGIKKLMQAVSANTTADPFKAR